MGYSNHCATSSWTTHCMRLTSLGVRTRYSSYVLELAREAEPCLLGLQQRKGSTAYSRLAAGEGSQAPGSRRHGRRRPVVCCDPLD